MDEIKRLQPTLTVIRELYLRSGNMCAMPNCHNPLVDNVGNFIGEICHIEAASKDGPRFNPNMTNEERRAFDNLILLCANCHTRVDSDTTTYTASKLKEIKKNHEARCDDIVSKIRGSVHDFSDYTENSKAQNCKELNDVLEWDCSDEELDTICDEFNSYQDRLKNLPLETRGVLSVLVKYAQQKRYEEYWTMSVFELQKHLNRDGSFIHNHLSILAKYEITSDVYADDDSNILYIKIE